MDISRVSQGQLIAGGGGLVLLISLFLTWASAPEGLGSANAFDAFSGVDIIMLIVAVVVVAVVVASAAGAAASLPPNAAAIVTVLGIALFGFVFGFDIEADNAGIGAWLGLAASIAIMLGGYDAARATRAPAARATRAPAAPPPPPATTPGGPPPPPTAT